MKNIKVSEKAGKLVLEIDLSKTVGQSKSGKHTLIATSNGNRTIVVGDKSVTVGLNVW